MAIKSKIDKLSLRTNLKKLLHAREFAELTINFSHVLIACNLPLHHNDPFDRLLIAQALLEDLILITQDSYMDAYGCQLIKN
jgi:PIN domain nuclease of toxin-antitoxin system